MNFKFTGTTLIKIMKWAAFLVATLATLYAGIALATGLPYTAEVTGIAGALETFFLAVIGFAKGETPDMDLFKETVDQEGLGE